MLSLTAFADELEREKARQRTYDAMHRKARALHVTGGRVFGYTNQDVYGLDGRRSYVIPEGGSNGLGSLGYVDAMRALISQALGIDAGRVSIKGKTNEGVDAVGRGEAIAAHAVAFVYAR